jgi:hypothetical protein
MPQRWRTLFAAFFITLICAATIYGLAVVGQTAEDNGFESFWETAPNAGESPSDTPSKPGHALRDALEAAVRVQRRFEPFGTPGVVRLLAHWATAAVYSARENDETAG